jgi:hypothetical protein
MSYVKNPVKYIGNIVKEYKEWNKTMGGPTTAGKKQQAAEAGQFWGAVLQGRRYNTSGKQVTPPKRNMGKFVPVKRTPPKK